LYVLKILDIIRVPKFNVRGFYPCVWALWLCHTNEFFIRLKMEKIRLKLKAYDHRVLDRSVAAIVDAVKRTGAEIRGPIPMPTKIKRYTVLKSPHVNKDSREQFEIRIHGRMIDIVSATSDTIDSLMKLDLAPEIEVEIRSMDK
jgi:small subunit ribosomal protein S10